MDELDNEQFAVGHYLQSLLNAPLASSPVVPREQLGRKLKLMQFRVGKLCCAVEHRYLAGIQPILEAPVPWPGEAPPWLAGYMEESAQQAKIIDLQALAQGTTAAPPEIQGSQRLIALLQGRFAIVADEVLGGINIYEKQVTWRGQNSQRPWLAGIYRADTGLVILDVPGLQELLPE